MFKSRTLHPRRPNPFAKPLVKLPFKVLITSAFRIAGARRSEGDIVHLAPVEAQHLILAELIEPVDPPAPATPAAAASQPRAPTPAPTAAPTVVMSPTVPAAAAAAPPSPVA